MKPLNPFLPRLPVAVALTALLAAASLAAAPGDIAPGWPVATDDVIFGAPAIGPHGEIVVGSEDNHLYSYNPDGSLRWIFVGSQDWIDCSPTIGNDGTVFVGSWDNFLYTVDGESGTLKWKFETGSLVIASPAIGPDGTIYLGSYDAILYALNPNGSLRWSYQPVYYDRSTLQDEFDLNPINSSPVLNKSGDTVYFGTDGGNLYAVSTASGTKRWVYSVNSMSAEKAITGAPAIGNDGSIYFTCENGNLYALNSSGQHSWTFRASESIKSSPVINSSGTICFAGQDGYLYAIDPLGFQLWETFVGDVFYCTPAIDANDNIIIGAYAGSVVIGAASAFACVNSLGNLLWEQIIYGYNDSSPNIAPDGSIYIGAHDGFLYKLEGAAGLSKSGWPRLQGNRRQTGWDQDLGKMELIDFFPATEVAMNDWIYAPWFGSGWLTEDQLPWIQHIDHGFLYVMSPSIWSIYFFDSKLFEWFYAPTTAPNFYYRFKTGTWLYHWPGTTVGTGRWFYDYSTTTWYPEIALN